VRDEALRYYGMKTGIPTRASVASNQWWVNAANEAPRASAAARETEVSFGDLTRARLNIRRRSSHQKGSKLPLTFERATPDNENGGNENADEENADIENTAMTVPAIILPEGPSSNSLAVNVETEDKPLPVSEEAAEILVDALNRSEASSESDDGGDGESRRSSGGAPESRRSSGFPVSLSASLFTRFRTSFTGMGGSKRASVGKAPESTSMDPKAMEEMKGLRDELAVLLQTVSEIPKALQQHQVKFAQTMTAAKNEVVEEIWDRFGSMPNDVQEMMVALSDMLQLDGHP